MKKHHYYLQANLYMLALHRFLKWKINGYDIDRNLGGYIYIFIRGIPNYSCNERILNINTPGMFVKKVFKDRILYLDNIFNNNL